MSGLWRPGVLALVCSAGCYSGLTVESPRPGEPGVSGTGGGGADGAPDDDGGSGDTEGERQEVQSNGGLRRLTSIEYSHTVSDLLDVEVLPEDVPPDLVDRGHSHIALAQRIGYEDVDAYYELALAIAERAAPPIVDQIACEEDSCLESWGVSFLARAFRRPVPVDVADRYVNVLSVPEAGETLEDRVVTFLAAVLSSPHFLYRQEIGQSPTAATPAVDDLDSYEIASRLSYLVWQTMPDDELTAAAARGELGDVEKRTAQLERMLVDVELRQGLGAFVYEWVGVFGNRLASKASAVLEGTQPGLAQSAERAFALMVEATLAEGAEASFLDLLVTDEFFTDAVLAEVLGVSVSEPGFQSLPVPVEQRRGILTHPLVIAAHSKEIGASPFSIGRFVYENVLCESIPPPPPDAPTAGEVDTTGKTLREALEAVTSEGRCRPCHSRIGPPGFAFLPFDPIGRFSAADPTGRPWDTSGELVVPGGGEAVAFTNVSELAEILAEQDVAAQCLAERLFRWTHGRYEGDADREALDRLGEAAVDSRAAVGALLRIIVSDPSFARVGRVPP